MFNLYVAFFKEISILIIINIIIIIIICNLRISFFIINLFQNLTQLYKLEFVEIANKFVVKIYLIGSAFTNSIN